MYICTRWNTKFFIFRTAEIGLIPAVSLSHWMVWRESTQHKVRKLSSSLPSTYHWCPTSLLFRIVIRHSRTAISDFKVHIWTSSQVNTIARHFGYVEAGDWLSAIEWLGLGEWYWAGDLPFSCQWDFMEVLLTFLRFIENVVVGCGACCTFAIETRYN
jgi:hypothetical protein